MKRLLLALCLFFAASGVAAATEITDWLSVDYKGIPVIGEVYTQIYLHGKDWKGGGPLDENTSRLKREYRNGGVTFTGGWPTVAGDLSITESLQKNSDTSATFEFTATSDKTIEEESTYLRLYFPWNAYCGKSVFIDKKEIVLPEKFTLRRLGEIAEYKDSEISIPTRAGQVTLKGKFRLYLLDLRPRINAYSIRIVMENEQKEDAHQLSLKFSLSLDDSGFHPLNLSKAANSGLKDEIAGDKKGGWTDQGSNDMSSFKTGIRHFEGVKYNITNPGSNNGKACLTFANSARPYFLKNAEIDAGGVSGPSLYLLHALAWPKGDKKPVGTVSVNYTDGTTDKITVMESQDVANWWKPLKCENGSVCWIGDNKHSQIGLFQSRFQIQNKPVGSLSLATEQNSIWMIVGATIGKTVQLGTFDRDFRILESGGWKQLEHTNEIVPGSIMDLSNIHKERVADRRLEIQDGHFVFADSGERIRLFGSNLCFDANYVEKPVAEMLAERMWNIGYNSVRLHHYDRQLIKHKQQNNILNPDRIDKLDYLVHCMKQRGLYVSFDLFTARNMPLGTQDKLEIKAAPSNQQYKMMMVMFPDALDDWKEFASLILNHVNPYTGIAWKDDPAIYSICLTNENCVGAHLKGASHPKTNSAFREKFAEWCAKNNVEGQAVRENAPAYNRYTTELQREIYQKTKAHVRGLGAKAFLTDLNHRGYLPLPFARQLFDYVDIHYYWDHPTFPRQRWRFPQAYKNTSALQNLAAFPRNVMAIRLYGKPFTYTEYNYCASNVYRSEMGLLMGAYSSLQDWDALYSFQFAGGGQVNSKYRLVKFSVNTDPIRLLCERIIALLFLRGDATAAKRSVAFVATEECLDIPDAFTKDNMFMDERFSRLGLITNLGTVVADGNPITLPEGITHCVGLPEDRPVGLPENVPYMSLDKAMNGDIFESDSFLRNFRDSAKADIYRSETGEIELNKKASSMRFVTPRSEGFLLHGEASETGSAVSARSNARVASIFVSSHDAKPITESDRLMVFHLTDVQNNNASFDTEEMNVWLTPGELPLLVRSGTAKISVKTKMADTAKVWAVDMTGARIKEMPVKRANGSISFTASTIQTEGTFLAYEIAEK